MEQILINLIAGALGGVGAGKSSPNFDLGTIGNIVSGLVGGGVLGQIVTLALPSVVAAAESGNLSLGGIISQVGLGEPFSRRSLAPLKTELLPDGDGDCAIGGACWRGRDRRREARHKPSRPTDSA